jgi:hypothetical protein
MNPYIEKWKSFVNTLNSKGIPLPTIRDPKHGVGSVSLTLVIFSSALVMAGIIGKWAGFLGGIDLGYAMQFLWTACSLYFGRNFGNITSKKAEPTTEDESK